MSAAATGPRFTHNRKLPAETQAPRKIRVHRAFCEFVSPLPPPDPAPRTTAAVGSPQTHRQPALTLKSTSSRRAAARSPQVIHSLLDRHHRSCFSRKGVVGRSSRGLIWNGALNIPLPSPQAPPAAWTGSLPLQPPTRRSRFGDPPPHRRVFSCPGRSFGDPPPRRRVFSCPGRFFGDTPP